MLVTPASKQVATEVPQPSSTVMVSKVQPGTKAARPSKRLARVRREATVRMRVMSEPKG
jgi:hypothetical protein